AAALISPRLFGNLVAEHIKNVFHKISLYADDVLLYLTEPKSTIPHLKELISQYGFYSGYKINIEKTEAMDVNGTISDFIKVQSGCKWPKNGIKYLGIQIPPLLCDLYEANYSKLLRVIKNDLERWDTLPISLIGRVESIRMNVLPRLLYLFQMLPVEIPKSTFDTLDKMITGFIWQKRQPRIRLKTLQLPKPKGGLKLPNFKYYYWAAQLKPLLVWLQNSADTRWLEIEESRCSIPLQTLPFLDTPAKEMTIWTKNTLKVWNKIQSTFKLSKQISLLSNIGYMKTFTPNNLDSGFKNWSNYGLSHIH
uniref:Reverse transcriptase domain-containing protein n=1 Tax=Xiphophorus maculatus TaxID=8083 RepID=A0A3B5QZS0_XIPMA